MSTTSRQRILGFPRRYIQGAGVLENLVATVEPLPKPIGIVVEHSVLNLLSNQIVEQLRTMARVGELLEFQGECTRAEIIRLSEQAEAAGVRSVLALGGGKTLDTGKGVAKALSVEIAISPTIASNDAPTSRLIVLYHSDHSVDEVDYLAWNPAMVIVDTQVIANAPTRFTRAGIGDALSKRFELDQVIRSGGQNFFGARPSRTASAFANMAFSTLMENADKALEACEQSVVTEELEQVVEACVLASGAGFENGGLSLAHAMCRGLSACDATRNALHGEMVAFALLIQLRLTHEGISNLDTLLPFYERTGLPLGFADLGGEDETRPEHLSRIAEGMLGAPYAKNFERALDADEIISAMQKQNDYAIRGRSNRRNPG